jgi:predicted CXXCH cytochrome family protein
MDQLCKDGAAQRRRRRRSVIVGVALVAATACAIGLWSAASRAIGNRPSEAEAAYGAGKWPVAAELARRALAVHKDDPVGLRVLARASARLGRDVAATAIYERRLDVKALEAEDHLLLGLLHHRQGRPDAAARAWKKVLDAAELPARSLEELARLQIEAHRWDDAILATERLSGQPGWEALGSMMLGATRLELNDVPGAADAFRRALDLDRTEIDNSPDPIKLRKVIARTFLRAARSTETMKVLQPILERTPDEETYWLISRIYLQQGDKARAVAALKQAGSYRATNLFEAEPSPYVGETRCEQCHPAIFRDSLASRHTQTYYRDSQLADLPLPSGPLPDPDDPEVTHTFRKRDGTLREETRVGRELFDAVIDYAFGTADRYLTTVSRDSRGGYHIARLSYHQSKEGKGWDRSVLDLTHPTRDLPAGFQGDAIAVQNGRAKCLFCHVTNPRTGKESLGPETADRAIGCERCHGPGGNHIAAVRAGFPDPAIISPSRASPEAVTNNQCNECHVLRKAFQDQEPANPGWVRSQGVGWARSRCNTESGGAFGCMTCHDPHQSARAISTAEYEGKCLTCHATTSQSAVTATSSSTERGTSARTFRSCPMNPLKGCVKCHMPPVRIDSLHMDLTDHYIRLDGTKIGQSSRRTDESSLTVKSRPK